MRGKDGQGEMGQSSAENKASAHTCVLMCADVY